MRRAVIVLGTTAAGLAALLSFKSHSLAASVPPASTPPPSTGSPQAMASATTKASAATQPATRTVTGSVANTQYGPMQVRVTLAGTKITEVTVLQRTDDGSESDQIDANAIPKLTSETLAAQSAHIDAVSGASYTSSGYIQSLQSALDQE
jgi:uncharacterized protein with FMN-binding domain